MKSIFILPLLLIYSINAIDKVDQLENQYVSKATELKIVNDKKVKDLNEQYLKISQRLAKAYIKALEKQLVENVKNGDLKTAIKIKNKITEIKEVLEDKPLIIKPPVNPLWKPTDKVTLRKYLTNSTWTWSKLKIPIVFMEGGKVQNDIWDKQKMVTSWFVTSINAVLLTRVKPNGIIETRKLIFHHDRKSYICKGFISPRGFEGTIIQGKKERSNDLQLRLSLSCGIYKWTDRTQCMFHQGGQFLILDESGIFRPKGYWIIANKEIHITKNNIVTHKLHFSNNLNYFKLEIGGKKSASQYSFIKNNIPK